MINNKRENNNNISKHIKKIIVTDKPMIKTTTQKVKRYQEIKKTEKSFK